MKYIERKSLLYKTGVEYGDYTINHIQGCSHGCTYPCYAFLMAKRFGRSKTYEDWCSPKIVSNAEALLLKEIPKYKKDIKSVQLCFTTDPFMYNYSEVSKSSIRLMELLNKNQIKCTALTKGILPLELSKLNNDNVYGITLVSLNENFREKFEPGAAPLNERIKGLYDLHKNGMKTWVSIEPYPTPNIIEQNLIDILDKISFVDKIIFGRLNYNTLVSKFKDHKQFYNEQSKIVIDFCKKYNIDFHIKNGTMT